MKKIIGLQLALLLASCYELDKIGDMDMSTVPMPASQAYVLSGGVGHSTMLESKVNMLLNDGSLRQFLRDGRRSTLTVSEISDQVAGSVGDPVHTFMFNRITGADYLFETEDGKGAVHLDVNQYGGGIFMPQACVPEGENAPDWNMDLPLDEQGNLLDDLSYNLIFSIDCDIFSVFFLVEKNDDGKVQVQEMVLAGR